MQHRIKNLQFNQNWSYFNPLIVHMIMSTMYITLLMSGWIQQLWDPEEISKPRGTQISQARRKSVLMIQERNNLNIDQNYFHPQLP